MRMKTISGSLFFSEILLVQVKSYKVFATQKSELTKLFYVVS